ncbi:MAG: CRISPR-associated protein Cas5 [Verrucomicrobia bacterium]|nr:CRISPR-associated protein Cas5 [Verrucomicrobiota bacterium]MBV8277151.1 CRISPR-associated protein Cas5 [Verrucomicrobiota bacterium]
MGRLPPGIHSEIGWCALAKAGRRCSILMAPRSFISRRQMVAQFKNEYFREYRVPLRRPPRAAIRGAIQCRYSR